MSLVEKDKMTELRSASDSFATAQTAEDDIQLEAVAYAINSAANTGLIRTIYQSALSENTISELESKGYTVKAINDSKIEDLAGVQGTNQRFQTLISWNS